MVVLITGVSRGLGYALLNRCYANGHRVIGVVRKQTDLTQLKADFPEIQLVCADVTDRDYETQLKDALGDQSIDVLINNAGTGTKAPLLSDTQVEHLRKEFDSHCVGAFATVKGALNALRKSDHGLIVNISSRRGSMAQQAQGAAKGSGCSYSYRIGKAAQNMLTLCLADELEDEGIRVVAIHPGRLKTEMAAKDALQTPEQAAQQLATLLEGDGLKNRDYISLEEGRLPW